MRARARTGVACFDGMDWHVIVEWTDPSGKVTREVYDPPFATEGEAEAKAVETAATIRQTFRSGKVTP